MSTGAILLGASLGGNAGYIARARLPQLQKYHRFYACASGAAAGAVLGLGLQKVLMPITGVNREAAALAAAEAERLEKESKKAKKGAH